MSQDLVSFTVHQSASLRVVLPRNVSFFYFFLFCWRLWLTIPLALALSPHYLVIWLLLVSVSITGVRNKKPQLYLCNTCETQFSLSSVLQGPVWQLNPQPVQIPVDFCRDVPTRSSLQARGRGFSIFVFVKCNFKISTNRG